MKKLQGLELVTRKEQMQKDKKRELVFDRAHTKPRFEEETEQPELIKKHGADVAV